VSFRSERDGLIMPTYLLNDFPVESELQFFATIWGLKELNLLFIVRNVALFVESLVGGT
jgi:hypothetical protein